MTTGETAAPDVLFDDIAVDKVGTINLETYQDTPLWDKAKKLLAEVRSVIVLVMEEFPEVVKYATSRVQVGELALRDLYNRNLEVVDGYIDWQAYKLVKKLHHLGFQGLPLPAGGAPFDKRFVESAFPYKHVAEAAGLGVLGWHSMLITLEFGARVRLACIISDAPLPQSTSVAIEMPCIKCGGACIKICPVSAIAKPQGNKKYKIDRYACNTYLNAVGCCAECLRVCPTGKTATTKAR
jgi:epoxyqueuosine reductase QueG